MEPYGNSRRSIAPRLSDGPWGNRGAMRGADMTSRVGQPIGPVSGELSWGESGFARTGVDPSILVVSHWSRFSAWR